MARANDAQKAERLNLARDLLLQHKQLPDAAQQLSQACSISKRQAYRYLEQALQLKRPVPVSDVKVAFTVKLSQTLVGRLRTYAGSTGLTLSEIVSRALGVFLHRGGGRG